MQITKKRVTAAIEAARFPNDLGEKLEVELQTNLAFLNFWWSTKPSAVLSIWLSTALICIADDDVSDDEMLDAVLRFVTALFDDFEQFAIAKLAVLELKKKIGSRAA